MKGGLLTKAGPQATRSDAGDLPEPEAIRLAQQGDERGFERIYRLHSQRVYALCLRMMRGNSAEAEELTQESFLQLFRKIGTFRGESAFSTWLHRLAFNIVLMRLRKRSFQVVSMDEVLEPGENTPAVFILHDVQGYEHNEIAAIRGCSLGNSKSQLHKARARLRQLLETGVPEKNDPVAGMIEPATVC
jgi:RNA polymerase sigma-70 factor, ECF subfamily